MTEDPLVNTNRHSKNTHQNNEEGINYKRTQTITHDPPAHSSTTQPVSESDENPKKTKKKKEKLKKQKKGKENVAANTASSSATKKQFKNPAKKLFQACAQCCRRKKAKISKSKTSFVGYVKEKSKKCRTKKKGSKQAAAATVEHPEEKDKRRVKIKDSKKAERKGSNKEAEEEYPLNVPLSSPPPHRADQNGQMKLNEILGIDGQDLTKSCCFLCAKNAMAIAAAISGQEGKSHASIQTTVHFKETSTTDKGSSPMMYVRTVQSSVKVKTRDMGTGYSEKKKKKKISRPKLNFKRLSIIPKIKFPGYPKVRNVACGTDNNNVPQCRARRGTHCLMENK
ncbi:uncharacterized protein LOC117603830 [Osmia lignaria lignaria]|uniref:uncharacterized protein LOC117603830 n=1 Tax=Osmia lignaria lignaria TaxID=1437193 RepID=UPI001479741F|nr:uncharacterized protein LOC117603830 [Osmia lignaria]